MEEKDKSLSRKLLEAISYIEARPYEKEPYKELAYTLMDATFDTGIYSNDDQRFETIVDEQYFICIYNDSQFIVSDISKLKHKIKNPILTVYYTTLHNENEFKGRIINYNMQNHERIIVKENDDLSIDKYCN
jgi:hypothetical protein